MMQRPRPTSFNAAEDAWLPLQRGDRSTIASLSEALTHAHEYDGIATDQPLATAALTRHVLLPIVLLTHDLHSPEDFRRLWDAGQFDAARVRRYLAENLERFEVFHPETPFLQVAGLTPASGEPKGASGLMLQVASGNNVPLFSPLTEGDATVLSIPEALVHLVTLLGWDTAAIKTGALGDPNMSGGKTTGNPTGPLGHLGVVLLRGKSLFHTLLLNVPWLPPCQDDAPAWERTLTPAWEVRQPTGILDLLTWPSRRVRLVPDDTGQGVQASVVAAGDRLVFSDPILEPHTRWRATKNDSVAQRPMRWQSGSSAWRGLDGLLSLNAEDDFSGKGITTATVIRQLRDLRPTMGDDYPLNVLCVGVTYGNQSAVIEDVYFDTVPLPLAALRADDLDVRDALALVCDAAEKLRRALNDLADNLRRVEGGDKLPWDAGIHPGNDAMAELTGPTQRLLRGLQTQPNLLAEGLVAWQREARRIVWDAAQGMLDAASPQAFGGRELRIGPNERRVRLADCEGWFRSALRKALPDLTDDRQTERPTP